MRKQSKGNFRKFGWLILILPLIYGCPGGGSGADLGSLLGGGAGHSLTGDGNEDGNSSSNSSHAIPEPMTVLLIGGGAASMIYFRKRKSQK